MHEDTRGMHGDTRIKHGDIRIMHGDTRITHGENEGYEHKHGDYAWGYGGKVEVVDCVRGGVNIMLRT